MDPKKTAWEHVLGEPVANPPGVTPMKVELDARFDGTFAQLKEWMNETFKNPDDLRVRVIVGAVPLRPGVFPAAAASEKTSFQTVEGGKVVALTKPPMPRSDAEDLVSKVFQMVRGGNKIEAIRAFRDATRTGLKEAKDFVETLQPLTKLTIERLPEKDGEDIPF